MAQFSRKWYYLLCVFFLYPFLHPLQLSSTPTLFDCSFPATSRAVSCGFHSFLLSCCSEITSHLSLSSHSLLNCTVLCMEPSPNCLILALPHLAQLAHCTDPVTFIIFHIEIKVSWALSLWIRATIVVSECISNALGCRSNAFWLKYAKSQDN